MSGFNLRLSWGNFPGFLLSATAFSVPVVAMTAYKGLAVIFVIMSVSALLFLLLIKKEIPAPPRRPLAASAAFVAWSFISSFWAADLAAGLARSAIIASTFVGGFLCLSLVPSLDQRGRRLVQAALLAGMTLAMVLGVGGVVFDAVSGTTERTLHKNGFVVLGLLLLPLAAGMWMRGWRVVTALVVLGGIVASWTGKSNAGLVAIAVAFGALAAFRLIPRVSLAAFRAFVVATVLLTPLALKYGPSWEDFSRNVPHLPNSAYHRYYIWKFVADNIWKRPIMGWGVDASRDMPGGTEVVAIEVPVPWRAMAVGFRSERLPLHPHNMSLQWWLELGGIGVALGLALILALAQRVAELPFHPSARAIAMSCLASGFVVSQVTYGAWQTWMISFVWLAFQLFLALPWTPKEEAAPP